MKTFEALPLSLLLLLINTDLVAETSWTSNGPWGALRISETYIQQTSPVIDELPMPSSKPVWRFQSFKTIDQLSRFLNSALAGRATYNINQLKKEIVIQEIKGIETRAFPSSNFIQSLTSHERKTIYRELAGNKGNTYHKRPVFIDSNSPADWFKGCDLNSEALKVIESLSYPIGDSLAFSDTPLLLDTARTKSEEHALIRAMTRTRLLYLELEIKPDTDIDSLKKYWFPEEGSHSSLPVFESLTRKNLQPSKIDLIEILPPLPKRRLGEFPDFVDGANGTFPGGLWTSFNFFNELPNEEDLANDRPEDLIKHRYQLSMPPYRYGDLITISDSASDEILHACIYIADDIAFTKNDRSLLTPWTMMKLKFIKARFSIKQIPKLTGWRAFKK